MALGVGRLFLLLCCVISCLPTFEAGSNLRVVRQWSELEFVFPSTEARIKAIRNSYYVKGNSVPIDVDVQYRTGGAPRIFVTNPRFDVGRPVTLGTLDEYGRLVGYPDYSWHDNQGTNCRGMTSVFRTAIDKCNRLWVMDAGKIGENQVCPPQLLAFDLNTDQLIFRHVVNTTMYTESSLFVTPVVDDEGTRDCSAPYIYVADVTGFAVLVVDVATNRSWRVTHRLFYPYPSYGTFTIDGESFDLMDGVLGMALSPSRPGRDRLLYFHALASNTENIVQTRVLKNDSFIRNSVADASSITVFPGTRPNQSAAEAIDSKGIMYFGLMEPPSIYCWNTATKFSQQNFYPIAVDQETLQFASGVKVITNLYGQEELWVLTSSFQRVMTGTLSSNRINFRIHAEKLSILLKNSPCLRT